MTRDDLFDSLVAEGYSGALEDMLADFWNTSSLEDYVFSISPGDGGLTNYIINNDISVP